MRADIVEKVSVDLLSIPPLVFRAVRNRITKTILSDPDLDITPIFFMSFFFCKTCNSIANDKTCPHPADAHIDYAGKIIREKLTQGEIPPELMMRKEVSEEILKHSHPFVGDK